MKSILLYILWEVLMDSNVKIIFFFSKSSLGNKTVFVVKDYMR